MVQYLTTVKLKNMPPADCNHETKRRLLQQEGGLSPGAPAAEVFPWESRPLCLSTALTNGVQATS